ncbi:hypothetical protein ACFQ3S_08325 [Mucilaginibacter terrae]
MTKQFGQEEQKGSELVERGVEAYQNSLIQQKKHLEKMALELNVALVPV